MAILDVLIERSMNKGDLSTRPQMLILTGDQIYADDVADALLHMIMDASKTLIKWDEQILENLGLLSEKSLKPGLRTDKMMKYGFTSGLTDECWIPKSHLIGLGEYILMYIFVWSDVLWDCELPDFDTVLGISGIPKIKEVLPGGIPDDEEISEDLKTDEFKRFKQEDEELQIFKQDIRNVRRVLANIPTYMILDDHEVTDDWNINYKWCTDIYNYALGRHVISNALAAYAICQAWGNTPDQFLPEKAGHVLLQILKSKNKEYQKNHKILEDLFLPPEGSIFTEKEGLSYLNKPSLISPFRWDYTINFDSFELVAVDTRTQRAYPYPDPKPEPNSTKTKNSNMEFPILINDDSLKEQIGNFSNTLVVLAFPAPLIGLPIVEQIQESQSTYEDRVAKDCEAPNLNPYFFERFLAHLGAAAFPVQIGENKKKIADVIIFTGDLHFGWAASLLYRGLWNYKEQKEQNLPASIRIFNLTASAFKNELRKCLKREALKEAHEAVWKDLARNISDLMDFKREITHVLGFSEITLRENKDLITKTIKAACLNDSLSLLNFFKERAFFRSSPATEYYASRANTEIQELKPTGAGRVDITAIKDDPGVQNLPNDWEYIIHWYEERRKNEDREGKSDKCRFLVAYNNLGIWSVDDKNYKMIFDLWWRQENKAFLPEKVGTQYILPFDLSGV